MMRLVSKAFIAALTLAVSGTALAQTAPAAPAAPVSTSAEPERKFGVSALAGLVFPGTITVDDVDVDTEMGFSLRVAGDFFVTPRISMGVYLERIAVSAEDVDADATMLGFGGTLVGRFGPTNRGHFRAGLGLAYQTSDVDGPGDDVTGFGISPFVDYVFPVGQASWFAHLGFNAQPSGGNDAVDVTWGPLFQLAVGGEFGQ
jgi:hypothetical protein